jgi:chromosome segregation ATPase
LILAAEHDVRRETEKVMARFREFCRLTGQLKVAEEAGAAKKAEIATLTREVESLRTAERESQQEVTRLSLRLALEPSDVKKTRLRGQIKVLNVNTSQIVSRRKQLEADLAKLGSALTKSENFNELLKLLKQVDPIRDEYRQALSGLAQRVDETTRWYGDHANDAVIKAALESANKLTPGKIWKFGPSSELLEIVRVLKLHQYWVELTAPPPGARSSPVEPWLPKNLPPDFPTDRAPERPAPDR